MFGYEDELIEQIEELKAEHGKLLGMYEDALTEINVWESDTKEAEAKLKIARSDAKLATGQLKLYEVKLKQAREALVEVLGSTRSSWSYKAKILEQALEKLDE